MGVLIIECPVTRREFSTGVQVAKENLHLLPNDLARAHCPHCGQEHLWRVHEAKYAKVIPPSDWIENQDGGEGGA
jgi:predicted RNA-binding Zn-ribbon protein involved in translation (DUF1610 family)